MHHKDIRRLKWVAPIPPPITFCLPEDAMASLFWFNTTTRLVYTVDSLYSYPGLYMDLSRRQITPEYSVYGVLNIMGVI